MPFDINNLSPGTWFPYPLEDNKGKVKKGLEEKVCLRLYTSELLQEVDEKTSRLEREFVQPKKDNGKINKRAPLQAVEFRVITNPTLRQEMLWDFLIVDWVLYDIQSKEKIPCNKEMKIKLMQSSLEFAGYVSECLEILTTQAIGEREEEEKN